MPESVPNDGSGGGSGNQQPSSSVPQQLADLEAIRRRWDAKLEADFATINEILRRQSGRDREAAQQSTNNNTQ